MFFTLAKKYPFKIEFKITEVYNKRVEKFDVVIIGPFPKDIYVLGGKERTSLSGTVYFSSFPLKIMGLRVAVVVKLAKKDFSNIKEFERKGIKVFPVLSKETTSIKNIYPTANLDVRICKVISRGEPFRAEEIPEIKAKVYQIGALIAGDIPYSLIKKLAQKGKIVLDVRGFIRGVKGKELKFIPWPEKKQVLKLVHFLKLDKAEVQFLTKKEDLREAAKELAIFGPKEILITSDKGALLFAQEKFFEAPFTPKEIRGRTGRGDTLIAAYVGKRLLKASYKEALRFAAKITSKKLETLGPYGA